MNPQSSSDNPVRGDESLRRGRWSTRGAVYFLTLCTRDRGTGLHAPPVANALRAEMAACEKSGHWRVAAGVIMPDHLHLLTELTGDLALSRVVARFKAKTRGVLLQIAGLTWQGNFYEHRLRAADPREAVLRYIMLNPHRGGLVTDEKEYPFAWLHAEEARWFSPLLNDGAPFPEWLR